jgi:hypothetical protein
LLLGGVGGLEDSYEREGEEGGDEQAIHSESPCEISG